MKKLVAALLAALLLPALAGAEKAWDESGTPITMTIGDAAIPAVLNDTAAARDLLTRLPCTVTVNRGGADLPGDPGEPLAYEQSDFRGGWQDGDFMWTPDGNRFMFFLDGMENDGSGDWIVLGHMDDAWAQAKNGQGSVDVALSLREDAAVSNRIDIEANGQVRTATLNDNPSADAFAALLRQGPVTVDMRDYGSFEKVGPLGVSLPRSDEAITTVPGDIILYQGNQITVYYARNSWNFTLLGHIDGATEESMREFLGDGDPTVTFSLHEEE